MLDFSLLKSKDYIDMKNGEFQDLKVFMQVECFGESMLNKEDRIRYEDLMYKEIDENNPAISQIDVLIL
jgi:hypothetical protein